MPPETSEFRPRRRVYLMRHADVEYADADGKPVRPDEVSLTARGVEQAGAAALALAEVPLDRVITSGLPRTEQTADAILTGRSLPRVSDERWREIRTGSGGVPIGSVPPEIIRAFVLAALPADLSVGHSFLAGETFGELLDRVRGAWADLLAARDWTNILVVSHGIFNRVLLSWLLGAPLGAVGKIEQDACCINLIEVADDGTPLVRIVNHTPGNPLKIGMTLSTLEGLAAMLTRKGTP